ncbi:GNAT family N-acetyltransferase [Lapillicoccus jejuensis]|uniref:Ribosomal protein S18 acetylase RimI-like enzyme n=1 Tax=Lapillicoccus jejuensis TaxID=402171 RepID=A0A542E4W4_9MICO|nr:GNAT family N-acetyltransferase [Lapillicoccus jejuensis]TQJ10365.1 ribosomal protein S18 acetylase RimI-like enzyme [Lapillicoccus jejuensis]
MATPTLRTATDADAPALADLVRRAYRGREGWTTESALLDDQRIDEAGVRAKLARPRAVVLVAEQEGTVSGLLACCEVEDRGDGVAYFGMFAVEPALQAAGVGRAVLAAAERHAAEAWGATTMEMTVIAQREELIAWYERRGYARTGETRPFPFADMVGGGALRDDLHFVVLARPIA